MSQERTIKSFTDLNTWQEGHKLVVLIYALTKAFPKEEAFGLTNQLRRAAVSVTSNIAEGFSRQTAADRIHFYIMSQGSLTEAQNQVLVARDVGYLSNRAFQELAAQTVKAHKLLTGLIKSTRQRGSLS